MVTRNRRQRAGRILVWLIAGLVVLFVALAAYHFFMRSRETSDAALMAELHNAVFAEDPLPAGPSDWPQFRGIRRDGISAEADLLTQWPSSGPKVLWSATCGSG